MTSRRKPESSEASVSSDPSIMSGTTTYSRAPATTTTRSPFLPTRLEALLVAIYPITLLLGSIFSILAPHTRNAPYNATTQSHPPEYAPSYFAQKKNIFNIYFVKVGWFWTTLAFVIFLLTNPTLGRPLYPTVTTRRVKAALRYASITLCWWITTQWFFGPALIDRGFVLTGGACEILRDPAKLDTLSEPKQYLTSVACKVAGGQWKGGQDISGHVFLLILGSAFLWLEILPAVTHSEGLRDGRSVQFSDGSVKSAAEVRSELGPHNKEEDRKDEVTRFGVKLAIGVMALMWWMLLMTAAFFHTWPEKFAGLLVAFGSLWVVYFLPRGVPVLRSVLGMPGV